MPVCDLIIVSTVSRMMRVVAALVITSSASAGFRGGQVARVPHHIHVFSHTCDMCVPLSHF